MSKPASSGKRKSAPEAHDSDYDSDIADGANDRRSGPKRKGAQRPNKLSRLGPESQAWQEALAAWDKHHTRVQLLEMAKVYHVERKGRKADIIARLLAAGAADDVKEGDNSMQDEGDAAVQVVE